jgi:hypothetical protein
MIVYNVLSEIPLQDLPNVQNIYEKVLLLLEESVKSL